MGASKFNAGSNPVMNWHPIKGGVEILLIIVFSNRKLTATVGTGFLAPSRKILS